MGINNGNGIYKGSDCPNDFSGMGGAVVLPLVVNAYGQLTNNGINLIVLGLNAWAEGSGTRAGGNNSHAEGLNSSANGANSHCEGSGCSSGGTSSHAEGTNTRSTFTSSHAEGNGSKATALNAHAEGNATEASGQQAHAEGNYTKATGAHSHAEGSASEANGYRSHAGGNHCLANGADSFAHGYELKTTSDRCAVFGSFNLDEAAYFLVGNGTDDNNRTNIFKIDKSGNLWFMHNGVLTNLSALLNSHNIT